MIEGRPPCLAKNVKECVGYKKTPQTERNGGKTESNGLLPMSNQILSDGWIDCNGTLLPQWLTTNTGDALHFPSEEETTVSPLAFRLASR